MAERTFHQSYRWLSSRHPPTPHTHRWLHPAHPKHISGRPGRDDKKWKVNIYCFRMRNRKKRQNQLRQMSTREKTIFLDGKLRSHHLHHKNVLIRLLFNFGSIGEPSILAIAWLRSNEFAGDGSWRGWERDLILFFHSIPTQSDRRAGTDMPFICSIFAYFPVVRTTYGFMRMFCMAAKTNKPFIKLNIKKKKIEVEDKTKNDVCVVCDGCRWGSVWCVYVFVIYVYARLITFYSDFYGAFALNNIRASTENTSHGVSLSFVRRLLLWIVWCFYQSVGQLLDLLLIFLLVFIFVSSIRFVQTEWNFCMKIVPFSGEIRLFSIVCNCRLSDYAGRPIWLWFIAPNTSPDRRMKFNGCQRIATALVNRVTRSAAIVGMNARQR